MFRKELMDISFDYGCFTTPQFTNYQYFVQIFIFMHWILSFWCWRQILSHIIAWIAWIAGYIPIYFLVFLTTSHVMKIFLRISFCFETHYSLCRKFDLLDSILLLWCQIWNVCNIMIDNNLWCSFECCHIPDVPLLPNIPNFVHKLAKICQIKCYTNMYMF